MLGKMIQGFSADKELNIELILSHLSCCIVDHLLLKLKQIG